MTHNFYNFKLIELKFIITEVEDGIEVEDEAEVEAEEAGEGTIIEADEVEEEEADDEGTGAPHVDITSYFPEAQVSAGKVSEVLVSVKVKFHSIFSKILRFLF